METKRIQDQKAYDSEIQAEKARFKYLPMIIDFAKTERFRFSRR